MENKNLFVAIGLNIFIPGLGYLYIGRYFLGILAFFIIGSAMFVGMFAGKYFVTAWLICESIMALDMIILRKKLKKCPNCAEMVAKDAKICKHCQTKFTAE